MLPPTILIISKVHYDVISESRNHTNDKGCAVYYVGHLCIFVSIPTSWYSINPRVAIILSQRSAVVDGHINHGPFVHKNQAITTLAVSKQLDAAGYPWVLSITWPFGSATKFALSREATKIFISAWWYHDIETLSLALCEGNTPVTNNQWIPLATDR